MPNISNADAFNMEAGILLAEAYKHFPNSFRWQLDEDTEDYPTEMGASRRDIQRDTILKLAHEYHFLNVGGLVGGVFSDISLTPAGLAVLKKTPANLGGQSYGKYLLDKAASGLLHVAGAVVPELLAEIAKPFIS